MGDPWKCCTVPNPGHLPLHFPSSNHSPGPRNRETPSRLRGCLHLVHLRGASARPGAPRSGHGRPLQASYRDIARSLPPPFSPQRQLSRPPKPWWHVLCGAETVAHKAAPSAVPFEWKSSPHTHGRPPLLPWVPILPRSWILASQRTARVLQIPHSPFLPPCMETKGCDLAAAGL